MVELYRVGNPINREERVNLNETFDDILRRFSSMQNTLNLLTGNQDVQNLLDQIDSLIQQAETSLDEIQNAIQSSEDSTALADVATSNANLATSNANNQAERAEDSADYIDSVKAQIDYFIGEQTNLQAQINQLVVSGDSSPEAAQARVGYTGTTYASLKARLDAEANLSIPGSKLFIDNTMTADNVAADFKVGVTKTFPSVSSSNAAHVSFLNAVNSTLGLSVGTTTFRYVLTTFKRDNSGTLQELEVIGYTDRAPVIFVLRRFLSAGNPVWIADASLMSNRGNPNGVIPAVKGAVCVDTENQNIYFKSTGTTSNTNTGWISNNGANVDFQDAVLINGFQGSVKYKKASDGLVTVRVKLTSVPTNSNGISFVNIPDGFRPLNNLPSTATIFNGATFVQVANPYTLRTNGNIVYINGDITSPNTNIYNSEVSYYADL